MTTSVGPGAYVKAGLDIRKKLMGGSKTGKGPYFMSGPNVPIMWGARGGGAEHNAQVEAVRKEQKKKKNMPETQYAARARYDRMTPRQRVFEDKPTYQTPSSNADRRHELKSRRRGLGDYSVADLIDMGYYWDHRPGMGTVEGGQGLGYTHGDPMYDSQGGFAFRGSGGLGDRVDPMEHMRRYY